MSILDTNIRLTGASKKTRFPAVAGLFYPADPEELREMINQEMIENLKIDAEEKEQIYSGNILRLINQGR